MRSTGGSVDAPVSGTYMARVVGLVDLDLQPGFEYQGEMIEPQYKVTFTYELGASRNKEDRPHWVSEDFKVSDHERSNMYARLKALDPSGRLTDKGADLSKLIGAVCMVEVTANAKGWAKITNVSGLPAGMEVAPLENDPVLFDWDEPDMFMFKRMPEFVQKKLKSSLNFQGSALHQKLLESGDLGEDKDGGRI